MPYDSLAIANFFIERSPDAINPMKAQKLVYYAHGWNLAINEQPLINERIQAWRYGPVVPQLYQDLKLFGASPIPQPVEAVRSTGHAYVCLIPRIPKDDGDTAELLDRVWQVYGGYSAVKLSNATHAEGSPWDLTWKRAGGRENAVIDDDLIKEDFKKKLAKANPAA